MTKLDFRVIKNAVAKQFDRMTKHELFRTDVDADTPQKAIALVVIGAKA
jgi:hypothetical protein